MPSQSTWPVVSTRTRARPSAGSSSSFVEQAAHDGGAIVLDLSALEYVSSAGLRCFMLASRQAKAQHGRIFVAALQPMVAEIFEISHFNLVFQVFPTMRDAMAAVSADAASAYEKG